jgi:antirestriction protein ArdC
MPHAAPAHKSFADRASLYQEITDKIIRELEQGRVPWVQPWAGAPVPLGLPKNITTGRGYTGINVLILWMSCTERGFSGQNWLTFRQALKIGAHVRKGERGTAVVYADRFIPHRERTRAAEAGDEPDAIPFLKRFTVFNADQCEDLPAAIASPAEPLADNMILPQAEALIRATGADIRIGGSRAFYVPSADYIQVPPPAAFFEPINFHRTVCHELGHNAERRIMPHDPSRGLRLYRGGTFWLGIIWPNFRLGWSGERPFRPIPCKAPAPIEQRTALLLVGLQRSSGSVVGQHGIDRPLLKSLGRQCLRSGHCCPQR